MRTSLISGLLAGFVLVFATACGGGTSATTGPATAAPGSQSTTTQAPAGATAGAVTCAQNLAAGQAVGISGNTFLPGTLSVAAGSSVTWANADTVTHTVTFDAGPDCGELTTGQSVTAKFPGPGSYPYHCRIHSSMHGTITVS